VGSPHSFAARRSRSKIPNRPGAGHSQQGRRTTLYSFARQRRRGRFFDLHGEKRLLQHPLGAGPAGDRKTQKNRSTLEFGHRVVQSTPKVGKPAPGARKFQHNGLVQREGGRECRRGVRHHHTRGRTKGNDSGYTGRRREFCRGRKRHSAHREDRRDRSSLGFPSAHPLQLRQGFFRHPLPKASVTTTMRANNFFTAIGASTGKLWNAKGGPKFVQTPCKTRPATRSFESLESPPHRKRSSGSARRLIMFSQGGFPRPHVHRGVARRPHHRSSLRRANCSRLDHHCTNGVDRLVWKHTQRKEGLSARLLSRTKVVSRAGVKGSKNPHCPCLISPPESLPAWITVQGTEAGWPQEEGFLGGRDQHRRNTRMGETKGRARQRSDTIPMSFARRHGKLTPLVGRIVRRTIPVRRPKARNRQRRRRTSKRTPLRRPAGNEPPKGGGNGQRGRTSSASFRLRTKPSTGRAMTLYAIAAFRPACETGSARCVRRWTPTVP